MRIVAFLADWSSSLSPKWTMTLPAAIFAVLVAVPLGFLDRLIADDLRQPLALTAGP